MNERRSLHCGADGVGLVVLERSWCERDAPIVAPLLLNKLLVAGPVVGALVDTVVSGRIIEVEAYTSDDPASHTFRGRTPRNGVMFGPAGRAYVYTSYGIHQCLNVVTGRAGDGQGVLIRAVVPIEGLDLIAERRSHRAARELANGPGKVGQAFGISATHNGTDLLDPTSRLRLVDDGTPPPSTPVTGPRIGITKGVATPWRFRVP